MQTTQARSLIEEKEEAPSLESQGDRIAAMAFLVDDSTEASLRGGLADQLNSVAIRRGGVRAAVRALKNEASPRVLLVDLSGIEDDPIKSLDDLAAVCSPDIKIIVLGERADIEFYRLVTRRLGVDEYLRKPLTRDAVSSLIGPFIAGAEPETERNRGGRVVAVCGAGGGVGATTIAVNLALQISEQTRSHVALLDLHLQGGHAAMMLGVQPNSGLRSALEEPEHVDGLLLDRVAVPIGDRLRLIAADESLESDPTPTTAGVSQVIKLLRQRFNIIIIDMPVPPNAAQREAMALARQALVVMNPNLASIRDAQHVKRMIDSLIGAGRVMTVLNKATLPGALKLGMIKEALGVDPEVIISNTPKQFLGAANLGRPALRESAALRKALQVLTQEISGVSQPTNSSRLRDLLRRS